MSDAANRAFARIMARIANFNATIAGLQAANIRCTIFGLEPAHPEADFKAALTRAQIGEADIAHVYAEEARR